MGNTTEKVKLMSYRLYQRKTDHEKLWSLIREKNSFLPLLNNFNFWVSEVPSGHRFSVFACATIFVLLERAGIALPYSHQCLFNIFVNVFLGPAHAIVLSLQWELWDLDHEVVLSLQWELWDLDHEVVLSLQWELWDPDHEVERDRDRKIENERQTDIQTDRDRKRQREINIERERQRDRERKKEREFKYSDFIYQLCHML